MEMKKILGLAFGLGVLLVAVSCKKELTYTVKFVNHDQTLLQELKLKEGELPNYTLDEPSKEGNAQYSYTFAGWDKDVKAVDGEAVYTAIYDQKVNSYRVTFKNDEGKILDTQILEYGSVPTYKRNEPTKDPKGENTYRFDGWDKDLEAVTQDAIYTATFKELTNAYTITFIDLNGEVLYENDFEYGETPVYNGETPTLKGNEKYSYVFSGWTEKLVPVEGDTTYRVKFDQVVNKYQIKFVDEENNLLETKDVEYGQVPEFTGTLPTLPSNTAIYSYSGSWDREFEEVTKDDVYVYEVSQTKNKYKVSFVNHDDSLLSEEEYEYGEMPSYKEETPTKESIVSEGYVFKGWDKELSSVTSNVIYKATYDTVVAKYIINFIDEEGEILDSQELEYGQTPVFNGTLPETPLNTAQYSYNPGWDKIIGNVDGNQTYTYLLNKTVNSYDVTINHLYLDGSVAAPQVKESKLFNELELYKGVYTYTAPTVEGYVPSHDYVKYTVDGNKVINIYYSQVDVLTDSTVASTSLSGEGTEESPYLIQSAADLLCFKNNVATYGASGKYVKMTKSIDLNNINFTISDMVSCTFDGNNCSIRGINVSTSVQKDGLIKTVGKAGVIKNTCFYGKVKSTAAYVGIIGAMYGIITNSSNYAEILGEGQYAGGIVGHLCNADALIKDCVNYGSVETTSTRAGGFAGRNEKGNIENSINYGDVTGTNYTAGIGGYSNGGTVTGCKNYGTISTTGNYAGGIVCYQSGCAVYDSTNYGAISSNSPGGIVGEMKGSSAILDGCNNYGQLSKITADYNGVIGKISTQGTITNCNNYYVIEE